ncbi:helix-turn-helix transcriptional regulator [Sphingobacteriales bacterium CHB3]|nr:helix-turn-helix transcriptional regulator [Sphingobacteriales bacterium CHB3]
MSLDTSKLKTWVCENPEKCPSVRALGTQHGMSVHTLNKEFHRKKGVTLAKFIDDVRLEAVKQILLTTDRLCFDIACQFTKGREDVLSRWFKLRTGMTMREFRLKHGNHVSGSGGGESLSEHELIPTLQTKIAN